MYFLNGYEFKTFFFIKIAVNKTPILIIKHASQIKILFEIVVLESLEYWTPFQDCVPRVEIDTDYGVYHYEKLFTSDILES